MFGFGKRKRMKIVEALTNQGIGGQSVLYKLFIKGLNMSPDKMRKIELTYFSISILTFVFLRFYKGEEKEQLIDDVSLSIINTSIKNCGEEILKSQAVSEYKERYKEYDTLLRSLFSETDIDSNITLLMHLYECVSKSSAKDAMLNIANAAHLINQYVIDNIDFVKNEI